MVLKLVRSEAPQGFFRCKLLPLSSRVSHSVGVGKGLIMCISTGFPRDVDVVGLGTMPEESLV